MRSGKVYGALGLARRAGKCITGDFACERAVKAGEALLVILDDKASDATKGRYRALCEKRGIELLELFEAGAAVGKPGGKIAVILDKGFADMIAHAAKNNQEPGSI